MMRCNVIVQSVSLKWCIIVALVLTGLLAEAASGDNRPEASPTRTVVWLSIDGIRPDYLDRVETPFLDKLIREGAHSRELVPVFPSLTFPSHVSQATGVKVKQHGVPGNSFIDSSDWRVHRYPWNSQLLEAEPIWNTATRQGVRTAVFDWPLSHAQRGEHATAFHGQRYIRGLSDEERLKMLLDAWDEDKIKIRRSDRPLAPLRLLMGYAVGPDSLGHQYGPDADPPAEKLEEVDAMLKSAMDRIVMQWEDQRRPADELYFILTTDHGMSAVHTLVNLERLAGLSDDSSIETITSGNVGHLSVREPVDGEAREAAIRRLVERAGQPQFARAWARDDLPEYWQYDHPTRTGDVVVVLNTGYTFSRRPDGVTGSAAEHGGPLGMHGYCPRENPEMNGQMVIWRYPEPIGGKDLGRVHSLQLHATVAKLLGIEPAEDARKDAIELFAD
jgi:predicted AlkP superfamily pyrophosphatase or phosphodiesterase